MKTTCTNPYFLFSGLTLIPLTGADSPWADGGEDCYEDPLWFTGLFVDRNVRMAEWKISGMACCPQRQ